jgi:hypothetical protein
MSHPQVVNVRMAIAFSAPMTRAIRELRKTQTRRTVKGLGVFVDTEMSMAAPTLDGDGDWIWPDGTTVRCPYGAVGDRLYVTEHWSAPKEFDHLKPSEIPVGTPIWYRADFPPAGMKWGKFRNSRFMCRWMSRITLEITELRVERVQEISEADALAEGFDRKTCATFLRKAAGNVNLVDAHCAVDADGDDDGRDYCYECAKKKAGRKGYIGGGGCALESDGPAFCDKCRRPITLSLTKYGVERELRIEDDPEGKEPGLLPCSGADAAVAHMIADGIGDLREEHMGRLAQIGFATAWEQINGKGSWKATPWTWVVEFKVLAPAVGGATEEQTR